MSYLRMKEGRKEGSKTHEAGALQKVVLESQKEGGRRSGR